MLMSNQNQPQNDNPKTNIKVKDDSNNNINTNSYNNRYQFQRKSVMLSDVMLLITIPLTCHKNQLNNSSINPLT